MSSKELLGKFGFKPETWEENRNQFIETQFPFPVKRFRIVLENYNMSMEENYFWVLNYLKQDLGFPHIYKTIDVFSAAENSAFFGVSQMRLGAQQDKISQFLATIGKMVKELFQLVRELRIIDERMIYYEESEKGVESSEITLKGIWIDMVQGGSKNPASVFGMAREVNYVSLPDLFFSTHPRTPEEVDEVVDTQRAGFNVSVKTALKRHLKTYLVWRKKTKDELLVRRKFTLQYLRQHYDIIRMYMTWVKPYIRHVRRLTLDEDKIMTPEMVSAFEGSMVEIEFLASKLPVNDVTRSQNTKIYSCVLAHFLFRTRPSMSYQQEGYQRGPIHVGKMEMNLRAYVWTQEEIDNYLKMKDMEDMELLKTISESVKSAMEALGGELENYLEQAGETAEKKEEEKDEAQKGLFGIFMSKKPKKPEKPKKPSKMDKIKEISERKLAKDSVKAEMFYCFKNYKKAHGLIMW